MNQSQVMNLTISCTTVITTIKANESIKNQQSGRIVQAKDKILLEWVWKKNVTKL